MKALTIVFIILFGASIFGQDKQDTRPGEAMMEASLSIAKSICKDHPETDVWVFDDIWFRTSCKKLVQVFALDKDNPFDDMIPLLQSVIDSDPNNKKS